MSLRRARFFLVGALPFLSSSSSSKALLLPFALRTLPWLWLVAAATCEDVINLEEARRAEAMARVTGRACWREMVFPETAISFFPMMENKPTQSQQLMVD